MCVLVSILVPTYNRAGYLREAIQSALAQSYPLFEILVLDDASSDNTREVVAEYKTDTRVKYIRHEHNLGITDNWRFGINTSKGEYFCILHDDDTIQPDYIELLVKPLIDDNDLIFSFCGHWLMNGEGKRLTVETEKNDVYFKRHLLKSGYLDDFAETALVNQSIPIGATLFRRSMIQLEFLRKEAQGSIDMWLLYQCACTKYKAYYIAERLMNYRHHEQGMSRSMPQYMLEGHLFRYRSILNDTCMTQIHPVIKQKLSETLTRLGIIHLRQGSRASSRRALKEALQTTVTPEALISFGLSCVGSLGTHIAQALRRS